MTAGLLVRMVSARNLKADAQSLFKLVLLISCFWNIIFLGVITYILLCGFPPFSSSKKDQKELFKKIREGSYSFPRAYWYKISPEAKAFVSALLTVSPEQL